MTVTLNKNEVPLPCPLTWKGFVNLVLPVYFSASLPGTQDDRTEPQAARENILPARGPSARTHEQTVPTYSPFLCLQFLPPFHLHPPVLTTHDGNDSQATEVDTKSSILAFSQKTPRNALGGREMYILDHLPDHRWQHRNPNLLSYNCFSLLIYQENLKVWAAQAQFPHHALQNLQGHRCARLSARLSPRLPGGRQEGRGGSASCPVDSDLTMHRGASWEFGFA